MFEIGGLALEVRGNVLEIVFLSTCRPHSWALLIGTRFGLGDEWELMTLCGTGHGGGWRFL